MSVTVVICNYNGEEHLPPCLEAVARMRGEVAECIVVDNASTDRGLEILAESFPEVRVVPVGYNAGPSVARNVGLREARTRWVLALDNDVIVAEDTLEKLLDGARETGAILAQPRSVFADDTGSVHYDGGSLHFAGLIALRNFYTPLAEAEGVGTVPVDCVISLALLVDREKVLEIGGYEERYFILFEDLDLSYRLRARGETLIVVEDTIVQHRAGTPGVSFREGPRYPASRVFLHSRNRWIFLAKNYSWRTLLFASPGLLLYELFGFLFALAGGHPLAWCKGKLDFLRCSPGLLAARREVQATRVRCDGELLVGGPLTVTPDVAARPLRRMALWVVDGVLGAWWLLVRGVV
jgi:GT2 family glycosyltransferase